MNWIAVGSRAPILPVEFIPKDASEQMWAAYYAHTETLFRESNPRGRLPDRAAIKQTLLAPNPMYTRRIWMVLNERGQAAAMGSVSYVTELSPDFEGGRHICHLQVSVDPGVRRQRIAVRLLQHLVQVAGQLDKNTIRADVDNDIGHEFCKRLRGNLIHKENQHRLFLEDINWPLVEEWLAKGRARYPQTRIETFQDCPERDIAALCGMYTEIMNQRPVGDIKEKLVMTSESRRLEEHNLKKRGIQWHTMISREQDGQISALTDILVYPQEPERVHQYFTGVRASFRRRGLAKRLKAEMLNYIVNTYPEAEFISTTTAKENEPMRAINRQLGFVLKKTYHMYRWPIQDLQRRVARLAAAKPPATS